MLALSISTTPASKESDALTVIGRRPQNKDAEGAVASANAVLFHGDVTLATLGQHAPDLARTLRSMCKEAPLDTYLSTALPKLPSLPFDLFVSRVLYVSNLWGTVACWKDFFQAAAACAGL